VLSIHGISGHDKPYNNISKEGYMKVHILAPQIKKVSTPGLPIFADKRFIVLQLEPIGDEATSSL
jgi:hypothetical protein